VCTKVYVFAVLVDRHKKVYGKVNNLGRRENDTRTGDFVLFSNKSHISVLSVE
jgi:hypothetical protein